MSELKALSDLMSEDEVYEKYKHIFVDRELREARQTGELEFYKLRKGIYYLESQLIDYLEKRKQRPCPNRPLAPESDNSNDSGRSGISGSRRRPELRTITDAGTSSEKASDVDAYVERALERQT